MAEEGRPPAVEFTPTERFVLRCMIEHEVDRDDSDPGFAKSRAIANQIWVKLGLGADTMRWDEFCRSEESDVSQG